MKDKLILIIIGILIGAIISTSAFYFYTKASSCNCNNQNMSMNGGTPPEMPNIQDNQLIEENSNETNN